MMIGMEELLNYGKITEGFGQTLGELVRVIVMRSV